MPPLALALRHGRLRVAGRGHRCGCCGSISSLIHANGARSTRPPLGMLERLERRHRDAHDDTVIYPRGTKLDEGSSGGNGCPALTADRRQRSRS